MDENDPDQVISMLRACVLSTKSKITVKSLKTDYLKLVGSEIPYRALGYDSVHDLLETIPDLMMTRGPDGFIYVSAAPSDRSKHIAELVSRQRSSSKRYSSSQMPSSSRRSAASWISPHKTTYRYSADSYRGRGGFNSAPRCRDSFRGWGSSRGSAGSYKGTGGSYKGSGGSYKGSGGPYRGSSGSYKGSSSSHWDYSDYYDKKEQEYYKGYDDPDTSSRNRDSWENKPHEEQRGRASYRRYDDNESSSEKSSEDWDEEVAKNDTRVTTRSTEIGPKPTSTPKSAPTKKLMTQEEVAKPRDPPVPSQSRFAGLTPAQLRLNAQRKAALEKAQLESICGTEMPLSACLDDIKPLIEFNENHVFTEAYFYSLIEKYVNENSISAPTIILTSRFVNHMQLYSCQIKLGVLSVTSFPFEDQDSDVTIQYASREMICAINRVKLPVEVHSLQPVDIHHRFLRLIFSHPTGLWNTSLPKTYAEAFRENIPSDWREIVHSLKEHQVQVVKSQTRDMFILKPNLVGINVPFNEPESEPSTSDSYTEQNQPLPWSELDVSKRMLSLSNMAVPQKYLPYLNILAATTQDNYNTSTNTAIQNSNPLAGGSMHLKLGRGRSNQSMPSSVPPLPIFSDQNVMPFDQELVLPNQDFPNLSVAQSSYLASSLTRRQVDVGRELPTPQLLSSLTQRQVDVRQELPTPQLLSSLTQRQVDVSQELPTPQLLSSLRQRQVDVGRELPTPQLLSSLTQRQVDVSQELPTPQLLSSLTQRQVDVSQELPTPQLLSSLRQRQVDVSQELPTPQLLSSLTQRQVDVSQELPTPQLLPMSGSELADTASSVTKGLTRRSPDGGPDVATELASLASLSIHDEHYSINDALKLPEEDAWDIQVTAVNSINEVWVRIVGPSYSELYNNMVADMEIHYMNRSENSAVPTEPRVGAYYALQLESCWHRVQVIKIGEDNETVTVFFIDQGDEEKYPFKMCTYLDSRFMTLPGQAVPCQLAFMEMFRRDSHIMEYLVNMLIGKYFVANVLTLRHSKAYAVFYYTENNSDINVNNLIVEKLAENVKSSGLNAPGSVNEVFLSHISSDGSVYIQKVDTIFHCIQYMTYQLTNYPMKKNTSTVNSYSADEVYLARYNSDEDLLRVVIKTKPNNNQKVLIQFIDFGFKAQVPIESLQLAPDFSRAIQYIPPQAVNVRLSNISPNMFTLLLAERLRELVPNSTPVLAKTVKYRSEELMEIEIFKRIQPGNLLVSVNNTLLLDPRLTLEGKEASTSMQEAENAQKSRERMELIQQCIKPYTIPSIGEEFDVHVAMASNPSNFIVQPWNQNRQLDQLMKEMQKKYDEGTQENLTMEDIIPGGSYAVLYTDGHWYRARVSREIGSFVKTAILVCFIDYGDYNLVPLDRIKLLESRFKDLPVQAIKAKLSDVGPTHADWSVEDCIFFQQLVNELEFVSVVMETGPDILNPTDTVIGLRLIDTTSEKDVYIDKLLVEKNHAVYINKKK